MPGLRCQTRLIAERNFMIIHSSEISSVYGITSRIPESGRTEIAFAGRSNSGKSSLINCLLNRKNLARTSSKPGKTVTINFYLVNQAFYFVDLPGYGYAKISRSERLSWGKMIEGYLNHRRELKAVLLLLDIRRIPNEDDRTMLNWIRESGYQPAVILTKSDKVKKNEISRKIAEIRRELDLEKEDPVFAFSSVTRTGRDEILTFLESLVPEAEEPVRKG